MWFSNALIFQYELDQQENLDTALIKDILKPCPPHARSIQGWLPPFSDELIHEVAGCALLCLGKEERLLPRGVVQQMLAEKVKGIETERGRALKRTERTQLAEELEFELLPKSFCLQKRLFALMDKVNKYLIINTASMTQASQFISTLRKSYPGLQVESVSYPENLSMRFTQWIHNPNWLPSSFQLASDCLLFSPEDESKRLNCKGYDLPAEEIVSLLSQGLVAAELSMVWNERIQFTLTHDFTLKRMKCLDYLADEFEDARHLEEEYQQQDAALTLLSGELRALTNDLLKVLNDTQHIQTHETNNETVSA